MNIIQAYDILMTFKPKDKHKQEAIEYILKYIEDREIITHQCKYYNKGICSAGRFHPSVPCKGMIDRCIRSTVRI